MLPGGGDGTISSVVDHFAYANVVFGLLPLGTANSFARELGIPFSLKGAIEVIEDRFLSPGGDNDDLIQTGSQGFFDAVLQHGLVDERKHLLGDDLGRGKEAGPQSGTGKDAGLETSHQVGL